MAGFAEYTEHDALGLAELVARGEVHPRELVEACLARIDEHNPGVGAVVRRFDERARASAEGPLPDGPFRGVPFLVKDLLADVAGEPTSRGSRFFAADVAAQDSELVRRFRRSGVILVGKTNTPEFGLTPTTEPALFGPTRNPWDRRRIAGGSSGGSAAAVATRMVPFASGGDGGGSIRIPASCCGLFGLKPTRARNPTGPIAAEHWRGLVVEHVLTRSVRDSAAMLDATHGPDAGALTVAPPPLRPFLDEVGAPPGRLRIAFTREPLLGDTLDPECARAVDDAVKLLGELGHEVIEARPQLDRQRFSEAFHTVLCGEVAAGIAEGERRLGRRARPADFEAATWVLGLLGRTLRAYHLSLALSELQAIARGVSAFFEDVDLLLTPTLGAPPAPLATLLPKGAEEAFLRVAGKLRAGRLLDLIGALPQTAAKIFRFTPFTPIFNVTGQPAMSVPLHWSAEGLPIGVQFVGRFGDEATLLRLAGQLEEARPWAGRRPPGC
ncbi:MAG: amidase [Myxococcales bacterium]|nr:amidase [Myxococcales bacterium]